MADILTRITELREQRGWSEYKLSKEAGIPQSTLSNLYIRKNSPTISTLESICNAFNITLSQFFAVDEESVTLSVSQRFIVEKWILLDNFQQEKVIAYIDGLLET